MANINQSQHIVQNGGTFTNVDIVTVTNDDAILTGVALGTTVNNNGAGAQIVGRFSGVIQNSNSGLPPEKWSSLRYGFAPCGGCFHGTEEAYA